MSQYEPMFELTSFRPAENCIPYIRQYYTQRIVASAMIHWSLYIGARMFWALRQDGEHANIARYAPWLDRLDQLCLASPRDPLDDPMGRLAAALELIYLRCITSGAKQGYACLRSMAPIFMQIAATDPVLWSHHSPNGISLAHALVSPTFDLGRFICMDIVASLVFGTPPLIEYDTTHPMIDSSVKHTMEWSYGCPPEFTFLIVKINQWRARRLDSCHEGPPPWKEMDHLIWAWRSRCDYGPDPESGRLVMRFSVQEGWRHALLIYLYMGMYGVTSHDPRVQSSVRQISLLHAHIWSRLPPNVYFMIPLLIAGICTRSESDRLKIRSVVSALGHQKTWLLQGVDFALVLDHLWEGVAADGRPVRWDDYIASRRAIVDLGA
ncbi:Fungal specific transcription factor domain [Ceratobasidium sp. AG-Ba]|nr:Fungal specific transcription factor domain [Ceratobasidium sp. AG-Ba]